nr:hypothetical protein [Streptomyces beijiangensis]
MLESSVTGIRSTSPSTSTRAVARRSRLEEPTCTSYAPPSTIQRSVRVSQYARSSRRTATPTVTLAPGSRSTAANPFSSRGARTTAEPGFPV